MGKRAMRSKDKNLRTVVPCNNVIKSKASAANCGKRSQVRYTIEVLIEGILEYFLTAACSKKQRQAGTQLECVNVTENLLSRTSFNAQKTIHSFDQAWPDHGMIEVGLCFACR